MTSSRELTIAIGDLHGHATALEALLESLHHQYGLFGSTRHSKRLRPDVTLVFTGDYIDRGTGGLEIIDVLMHLSDANHDRVIPVIGNHELMALACLDDARALVEHRELDAVSEYGLTIHGYNGGTAFLREFGSSASSAFRNYVRRMASDGDIGSWLRALPPFAFLERHGREFLFMHADLGHRFRGTSILREFMDQFESRLKAPSLSLGGTHAKFEMLLDFFFNRSFEELSGHPRTAARICKQAGVDFIVTGHTPHETITKYGDCIFDIDVGMTPTIFGSTPQALVISSEGICAFTVGEAPELLVPL